MRIGTPRSWIGAVGLTLALLALLVPAASARAKRHKVLSLPVTFSVTNVNRSAVAGVPCPVDGLPYEVHGHLTGPDRKTSSLGTRKAVTLYLHGLGLGEWLWNFDPVPAYNYVRRQAQHGHVSVSVDRIGYGASGHPPGLASCIGSQADVVHQIVQALRGGTYRYDDGADPKPFKHVALVGHSAAGEIANVEAYSFGDIDALAIVGFAANNLPKASLEFGYERTPCEMGGEPAGPGLPGGYGLFGRTPADFRAAMFRSAPAKVIDAALPLHHRDPCGDNLSLITTLTKDAAGVRKIKAPVLVICGSRDVLYSPFNCTEQSKHYTHSRKHSVAIIKGAGHALPIERQAGRFRTRLGRWLGHHGF